MSNSNSNSNNSEINGSKSLKDEKIIPNENSPLLMDSSPTTPPSPKRLQFRDDVNSITIIPEGEEEEVDDDEDDSKNRNRIGSGLLDEIYKTGIMAIILAFCFFLNTLSLVLTHQRLPNRNTTNPLPDIILDNLPFPTFDNGLYIAEIMIMFTIISTIILITLHRFRWIVYRRIFFVLGVLYFFRAITMYVTVFPEASYTYFCSPKFSPLTFIDVITGTFKVLLGIGLSINGEHTYCGDYMYSGHTVILVMSAQIIQEYSPNLSWKWRLIHGLYWIIAIIGILLVLSARGHYTIDVIVAYYFTTRLWWIYHTLANYRQTRKDVRNFLNRVWWFRIFEWLESKIKEDIPHHYSLPFMNTYVDIQSNPITIVKLTNTTKYR